MAEQFLYRIRHKKSGKFLRYLGSSASSFNHYWRNGYGQENWLNYRGKTWKVKSAAERIFNQIDADIREEFEWVTYKIVEIEVPDGNV